MVKNIMTIQNIQEKKIKYILKNLILNFEDGCVNKQETVKIAEPNLT